MESAAGLLWICVRGCLFTNYAQMIKRASWEASQSCEVGCGRNKYTFTHTARTLAVSAGKRTLQDCYLYSGMLNASTELKFQRPARRAGTIACIRSSALCCLARHCLVRHAAHLCLLRCLVWRLLSRQKWVAVEFGLLRPRPQL